MFRHVAAFELKYQLKSPVFWGTFIIFFLLTFGMVMSDDIRIGWGGQVYRNSPFTVGLTLQIMSIFAMFIMTAFTAGVVLRDDETGFGPIIQATPLSRFTYLFGRFTGGFVAGALAFLSVPLGMLAATFYPGIDPDTLGPVRIGDYLYYYALFCVPTLFLLGAGMFALATSTRSIVSAYVGGLVVLAVYLFTSSYLRRPEFGALATLSDPFGLASFNWVAKNWTAYDRNTLLAPFLGLVAKNRAIWVLVGFGFLALAWRSFSAKGFAPRGADRRPARETQAGVPPQALGTAAALAAPTHRALGWGPLAALTRFELLGVFRSPLFVMLLGIAFLNQVIGLWYAGDDIVTVIYPVTRVMIQALTSQFTVIPLFVAAFYAGELVWRDRERRFHEIVDSTPAPDWTFLVPKILAIFVLLLGMGLAVIGAAIVVQLLKGFTAIEYGHYFTWFLAPWLITMALYAVLAIFVQTLVPHKFVGLLVMLLYYIAVLMLPTLGLEDHLYLYATTSETPLSDMNGLGNFAAHAYWYRVYWLAFGVILTVLAYGLWRRGASAPLKVRLRNLPGHLAGTPAVIAGVAAVVMAGCGGTIFYNTHILNHYRSFNDSQHWQADYEKTLMPFEQWPEPKITDVKLDVDLHPRDAMVTTRGSYIAENKTGAPLKQMFIQWARGHEEKSFLGTQVTPEVQMRKLDIPGARLTRDYEDFHTRLYTFDTPLAPGQRIEIRFETFRQQKGFRNSANETRIVDNGTFIDNFSFTPSLGIMRWPLLQDRGVRRKYGLKPDLVTTPLEDPRGSRFNYLRHDGDYVNTDITVHGPADQVLVATGHQVAHDVAGDRQTVRFKSEVPLLNFLSIQSAKYKVRRDHHGDVAIDIYYHPSHAYNVERFVTFAKEGLDYYSKNFSPYQYKQFRILEFPDYNNFAQAFPGMVPYSEAAGFITKVDEAAGVDFINYVTAHELGHQWWFHQLTGADQQGSTVLSETLAQYSAIMVMEHHYGQAMIRRFLKRGAEGYLRARGKENVAEPPLDRVQEQAYVRYEKGGVVMYLLKDQLGEDKVNAALRSLLHQYALKGPPYPSSPALVAALRAQARPDQQQLITDLFSKITLYDLKTRDAQAVRRADGKWKLTMTVEAHKRYADGKGIETEAPLNELIDIGVFAADPNTVKFTSGNVISLAKQRIATGLHKIVMVLDRQPKYVGIDPYLKYIDRINDDNIIAVK